MNMKRNFSVPESPYHTGPNYETDPPQLLMRHAHIRYNSDSTRTLLTTDAKHEDAIVSLLGWDPKNARIENCQFERDENLKPGQAVITPLPSKPKPFTKLRGGVLREVEE